AENPIPEFLRGQQLEPLVAGQKVVTIQVPVDNWVDLGWGDTVQVGQSINGVSDSGGRAEGTLRLDVLSRVRIYALPQFAPERAATVPVCLVVNAEQARELLKWRGHGTFQLTVVQKHEPTPIGAYGIIDNPTYSPEATPQTYSAADEPQQVSDQLDFLADPVPTDEPLAREAPPADNEVTTSGRIVPDETPSTDEPTVADLPEPQRAPMRSPDSEEAPLPTIEPSEAGTIRAIEIGSQLSLAAGSSLVVEDAHSGAISRVTGFDPAVIRVTALSRKQLQIEGLTGGTTVLMVTIPDIYKEPLRVPVHVHQVGPPDFTGVSEETDAIVRRALAERQREEQELAQARQRDEVLETLTGLYPDADLQITWIRDSLLLRGTISDGRQEGEIVEIAEQFAPNVLNQLRVADMAPDSEVAPRSIPAGKRVVSISLGEDVLEWLKPDQLVDIGRIRAITQVVEREGQAHEVVNKVVEVVVAGATVSNVLADEGAAVFVVSSDQVEALESIMSNELMVTPHAEPNRAISESSYRSDDTLYEDGSEAERPAAADDEPDPSLRDEIRALHEDVRRLIVLLEQRMSDGDVHPYKFESPGSPSTDGAEEAPAESEASEKTEERQTEAAPAESVPQGDAEIPDFGGPGDQNMTFRQRLWDEVGLRVSPLREDDPRLNGQPYHGGLLVDDVRPSSTMATAGLRAGDILVGLHVWETVSDGSLQYVLEHRPGDQGAVKFFLVREGETRYGSVDLQGWRSVETPGAVAEPLDEDAPLQAALSVGFRR
ncbi:MAG: pilus assembly protein N-terminal domain-containing protein, partial [Planctomycetaceae bacterium]|nr:pilus assembly protein N-terminal domain-containing protein [Planctomycetaceae bacterium]